jgi:hypothetical protein
LSKTCAKLQEHLATTKEVDVMKPADFLVATRQLAAAAELLAKGGPQDRRSDASEMLAFFRRYDQIGSGLERAVTSNDELFALTAQAALTMAGRNEFPASHALLEQARSLLPAT